MQDEFLVLAVCCSVLQRVAACCNVLQSDSLLQCAAACCSVLQSLSCEMESELVQTLESYRVAKTHGIVS